MADPGRSRIRPKSPDADAIRDEVADRIEEATDDADGVTPRIDGAHRVPRGGDEIVEADLSPAPKPKRTKEPPAPTHEPTPKVAMKLPTGPVRARAPWGSFGCPWENATRFLPHYQAAHRKYPTVSVALGACVSILESCATPGAISKDDGHGGGPARGIMQVKAHWDRLAPGADVMTAAGGILLGFAVMDYAIREQGSWQNAIRNVYHPGVDPNSGATPETYVQSITALLAEWEAATALDPGPEPRPPVETDPYHVLMGGDYPPVTYGFLADVGLNFYAYGVNHGTQRSTQHTGDDIAVACGTPLYAPAPGIVDCVGHAGTPRWGQSCGAYGDDGGGKGNLTILLDPGKVKLTLGHVRDVFVRPGDRVVAGQRVATVGTMRGCHVHVETSVERTGSYWLVDPKPALREVIGAMPPKDDPRTDWIRHDVPGAPNGLRLPPWITVKVQLTPRGPNRSGRTLQPIGSVFHETGNTRSDAGAQMHATWQANGTPGHPDGKIGVHAYIENDLIIFTLPLNEQGVHAGDSRNQTTLGYELCVNSTRDAALSERTAMHLHAATLADVISPPATAKAAMWSHTTTGCPATINRQGRWGQVEAEVDRIIREGGSSGPGTAPPPPGPAYATLKPVPFDWTGDDVTHGEATFIAIHRNFVARRDGVRVYQYATRQASEVRAPLSKGDESEINWTVFSEGEWWLVSRWGSRIRAKDMTPSVAFGDTT
ncbi:MAG: peptidoglycan DD-metalloendopeptidase family protein [Chloroflexota bacterium]|nr:peptidoglycan DD-metalloendopeptidase family protein [Chloroflexota bacterium]